MKIRRRNPIRLEEFAFAQWLRALNSGLSIPMDAPSTLLIRALAKGAKLEESTIIRVFQAASYAGVEQLKLEGEIFNPNLLQSLASSLSNNSNKLKKISVDLSPRLHMKSISLLMDPLKQMCNLKEVHLTGGASDELLEALSAANAPIEVLDFSYSQRVTDKGLKALVYFPTVNLDKLIFLAPGENSSSFRAIKHLNLWETKVTTKGCVLALQHYPSLCSLSCQWTLEALLLLYLKKHKSLNLEQLLIYEDDLSEEIIEVIKSLCPRLKYLTIRRPKSISLTFDLILRAVPLLEDFTVLQFSPYPALSTPMPHMPYLLKLHLSSIYAEEFDLSCLLENCPVLSHLTLEGLKPKVSNMKTTIPLRDTQPITKSFDFLKELRIITTFTAEKPLEPDLIVWIMNHLTKKISLLDLGCCRNFEDFHFTSMIANGSLTQLEDLRLSGTLNISDRQIQDLMENCPKIRRIVFKMISKKKLAELESLKVDLRVKNIDLELITYGYRI